MPFDMNITHRILSIHGPDFPRPRGVGGEYVPPPDKSITHRALMLGAVCSGRAGLRGPS